MDRTRRPIHRTSTTLQAYLDRLRSSACTTGSFPHEQYTGAGSGIWFPYATIVQSLPREKHIITTIIWLDEAKATHWIEELDAPRVPHRDRLVFGVLHCFTQS